MFDLRLFPWQVNCVVLDTVILYSRLQKQGFQNGWQPDGYCLLLPITLFSIHHYFPQHWVYIG